jgi:hypothetical protein
MAEFVGGFWTIFLHGRVVSPTPNPHPAVPGLCIYIPQSRVAQLYPQVPGTHFSRLLRHAWVTVGRFLFPGHHTGNFTFIRCKYKNRPLMFLFHAFQLGILN